MNTVDLKQWINKTQQETDEATLAPIQALAATLDLDQVFEAGSVIPPLWHWLFFLPRARRSEIGPDGHPKRGGFLPPVELPRRMWAGSRLQWQGDLRIGEQIKRKSVIEAVESKSGRSGELVFVKVRHEVSNAAGALALTEWQDIVYREAPAPSAKGAAPAPGTPAPAEAQWSQSWQPDPVLLFRFSALTFNGHRIHYDRPYAMNEEGYSGLVVHGPLLAMLMMQLARQNASGKTVRGFEFRGVSPVIDTGPFEVCGNPDAGSQAADLFVRGPGGVLSTQGKISFAD